MPVKFWIATLLNWFDQFDIHSLKNKHPPENRQKIPQIVTQSFILLYKTETSTHKKLSKDIILLV